MTISSTSRKAGPFTGNGVNTVLPFSFRVFTPADVVVIRADSAGNETTLVKDFDYTVSVNTNQDSNPGGNVTLKVPAPAGVTTTLTTMLPYLQGLVLTNSGGFFPDIISAAFDRLVVYCQQLGEQVSRSTKLKISNPAGVSVDFPTPVPFGTLGWDRTGTQIISTDPSGESALAAALADSNYGVSMVAGASRVVSSIAALKALKKTGSSNVFVTGYYSTSDGGGGHYSLVSASPTGYSDNGGTIIIANDGGVWKMNGSKALDCKAFGMIGDGAAHTVQELIANGTYASLSAVQSVLTTVTSVSDCLNTAIFARMLSVSQLLPYSGIAAPNGNFYFSQLITIPKGRFAIKGTGETDFVFGSASGILFGWGAAWDKSDISISDIVFTTFSSQYPLMNMNGSGGQTIDISGCEFYSDNSANLDHLIMMHNIYGSFHFCRFCPGTGVAYTIRTLASISNCGFNSCIFDGYQSKFALFQDGDATVYGSQGFRFVECTMLDRNNGLYANAGAHLALGITVVGCMVDSMDKPFEFWGAEQIEIVGNYIGGNSATQQPIFLSGCKRVTITGNSGEAYGHFNQVSPPPKMIGISGNCSNIKIVGNSFNTGANPDSIYIYPGASVIDFTVLATTGQYDAVANSPLSSVGGNEVATASWVRGHGPALYKAQHTVTASTALTDSDVGCLIAVVGAGITVTLPDMTHFPQVDASLTIISRSNNPVTLAGVGSQGTGIVGQIPAYGSVTLTNDNGGNTWICVARGNI